MYCRGASIKTASPKNTIPAEAKDNAYYHITQFNNVT